MELHLTSKITKANTSVQQVFFVLQSFRNFGQMQQHAKNINDFQVDDDTLSFNFKNMLYIGMRIIEREEFKTIKVMSEGRNPFDYFIWIQLKEKAYNDTRIRMTLKAEMGYVKRLLLKYFLQRMLNNVADQLAQSFNQHFGG